MKRRAFLSFLAGIPVLGPMLRAGPEIADESLSSTYLTDAGEYTFTCYNGTVATFSGMDEIHYIIEDGVIIDSREVKGR